MLWGMHTRTHALQGFFWCPGKETTVLSLMIFIKTLSLGPGWRMERAAVSFLTELRTAPGTGPAPGLPRGSNTDSRLELKAARGCQL